MIRFTPNNSVGEVAAPVNKGLDYLALPRTGTIAPVVGTTTTAKITDDNGFKNLRMNIAGLFNMHYHDLSKNSTDVIPSYDSDYGNGDATDTGKTNLTTGVVKEETFFQKFTRETAHAYYVQGQEVFTTPSHIEKYTEVVVSLDTVTYSFSAVSGSTYDILIARKAANSQEVTVDGVSSLAGDETNITKLTLDRADCFKVRVIADADASVSLAFPNLTYMYNGNATDVKAYLVTGLAPGDVTAEF
jgi:hypothetical protein